MTTGLYVKNGVRDTTKMVKMTTDCRIFKKPLEKGTMTKMSLRHKADGSPLGRMRKESKETRLEIIGIHTS